MPSIFFISLMNGAAWGGSEELWYRTALYAAREGYKVGCACYAWAGKEEKLAALERAGCTVYRLENKGREKRNLAQKLRFKLSKMAAARQAASLPLTGYDTVVVNQGGFEVHTPAWRTFYQKLPRYVLLFHNYSEGERFSPSRAKALKEWTHGAALNLFAADRIRAALSQGLDFVIPRSGVLLNPITFVPPGTPPPYPVNERPFVLVMLAALEVERKAQDRTIEALAAPKWKDRDWVLHLYGEGKSRSMLESLIAQHGLQEKVFLRGLTADVKGVLNSAHLLLQCTHMDAMPLSVVEAMAMARPVVASRIGDMPAWVKPGENGWISEDASPLAIDIALEAAWKDREHWEERGRRSYETFKKKFPESPEAHFLEQVQSEM